MKTLLPFVLLLLSFTSFSQNQVLIAFQEHAGGPVGYINIKGEVVIKPQYKRGYNFSSHGYAFVCVEEEDERRRPPGTPKGTIDIWKMIDETGSEVEFPIPNPRPVSKRHGYGNSQGFVGDVVVVRDGDKEIAVSSDLKLLFEEGCDNIGQFHAGYTTAERNNTKFYISEAGKVIYFPPHLHPQGTPFGGLIRVCQKDVKDPLFGFVDMDGKIVIEPKYEKAGLFTGCGVTWFRDAETEKIGLIDTKGEVVMEPRLDMIINFDDTACAAMGRNADNPQARERYYKIVTSTGEVISLPDNVDRLFRFSHGLALIQFDDKSNGFINNKGEMIIEAIYDNAHAFIDGIAFVLKDKKWGAINTNGEVVIPIENEVLRHQHNGMVMFERKGLFGYYNYRDGVKIEAQYETAYRFQDGYAAVLDAKTKKWGMIDRQGNYVVQPTFGRLFYATEIK